ncbi:MAG TPA: heme-degrading domain-containing protein [Burkholderiales bacterium]|nr:heme-degrading domain-containing protein [Burkholderiales bacterium]
MSGARTRARTAGRELAVQQLQALLREEAELQFAEFTNDTALALGMALVEAAKTQHKAVTIDICRNGQQRFHCALAGASADNDAWIRRKNNVVNRYGHSSLCVGTEFRARGTTFEDASRLDIDRYAAHGGAFPVIVRNVGVVGTVTVSGLPQLEDHALVVGVLRQFLSKP